jgi:hypothetical protein
MNNNLNQIALQRSLNLPLDDPRVRRIQELGAKRNENTKEEEEALLRLILNLKKELPSKK